MIVAAIVGFGVGLVDGERFAAALTRHGERLRRRLFTAGERASATSGARGLAARFAAKSAARRALGLGSMAWCDVEVVREAAGPPGLRLHGAAGAAARALGVTDVQLSLSHEVGLCIGQVILQAREPT